MSQGGVQQNRVLAGFRKSAPGLYLFIARTWFHAVSAFNMINSYIKSSLLERDMAQ